MKKNFVILGGGTAGWFTALFIQKTRPNDNVSIIESTKIGTIGVGEGTTPGIIHFFNYLDIPIQDVIKNTNATIKNGISFENWNGDGKKYFHAFYENLSSFRIPPIFLNDCFEFYLKNLIHENKNLDDYQYSSLLSYQNKVDIQRLAYALHFDAGMLVSFLKKTAIERGITHIDAEFESLSTNDKNDITKITLNNGQSVDVDFVFDCSGLAKKIIGEHYKTKWISYKEHLPMKKAIIIPKEKEDLFPYTKAIAMKYGWIFEIPLQHRVGRGYIFDSDYINEEQALKECEEYYGEKINVKKVITFDAGRYDKVWVNNCLAVGLSANFIEPLEATSLFLTIEQLMLFNHFHNTWFEDNKNDRELYNSITGNNMKETLGFIYLHYLVKRKDSQFWIDFPKKYKAPKFFEKKINKLKENNIRHFDCVDTMITAQFRMSSYIQVAQGLGVAEKPINMENFKNIQPSVKEYKKLIDYNAKYADTLTDYLKKL